MPNMFLAAKKKQQAQPQKVIYVEKQAKKVVKKKKPRAKAQVIVTSQSEKDMRDSSEPTAFGTIIKNAGRALGGYMGGPGGSTVGGYIADKLSKLLGQGAYQMSDVGAISRNSISNPSYGDSTHMRYNNDGTMRIRHREFIQDITGSTAFVNNVYAINPGNTRTFPWIYRIAQQFQTYQMEGLCFEFVSTSADALNSTNTALGAVVMGVQYDSIDRIFQNKQEAENSQGTISGKPSSNMVMCVECRPGSNPLTDLYIVRPNQTSPSDIRFQNLGNFQIMTVGMQAAAVIGELWVSYDVILKKPILGSASAVMRSSHVSLDDTVTDSTTTSFFFGTDPTILTNDLNIVLSPLANKITIPANTFLNSQAPVRVVIAYSLTGGDTGLVSLDYMSVSAPNTVPFNVYTYNNVPLSANIISNGFDPGAQFFQYVALEIVDLTIDTDIVFGGTAVFPANGGSPLLSGDIFISLFESD